MGTENDSIVLDFFAGSGSTAQAVMTVNAEDNGDRQCISIQLPEPVTPLSAAAKQGFRTVSDIFRRRCEIAAYEIQHAFSKQLDPPKTEIDLGLRTFRLVDTNFSKWRQSSDVEPSELAKHLLTLRGVNSADDATPDDLLTEILLKQGYSLTEQIESEVIAGLDVRIVRDSDGDAGVLAYLDEHSKPTLEQLRAFVDEEPTRMIVLEDAFQGDDELKTNLVQLCKSKGIEVWTA